jgi:hypothetical protein
LLKADSLESDLIYTLVFVDDRGLLLDFALGNLVGRLDVDSRDFTFLVVLLEYD